jgi:predicted secreted protein
MNIRSTTFISLLLLFSMVNSTNLRRSQTFDHDDFKRRVDVQEGDKFTIKLEGNPTTGYSWKATEFDNHVNPLNLDDHSVGEYVADHADAGHVGGGGVYLFKFEAKKKGDTEILLQYKRPWGGKAADELKAKIRVK